MALEKNREDQLNRSCEEEEVSQGDEEERKANSNCYRWRGECFRKYHVVEGMIKERIEEAGRRGRRRKQLLNDFKEKDRLA